MQRIEANTAHTTSTATHWAQEGVGRKRAGCPVAVDDTSTYHLLRRLLQKVLAQGHSSCRVCSHQALCLHKAADAVGSLLHCSNLVLPVCGPALCQVLGRLLHGLHAQPGCSMGGGQPRCHLITILIIICASTLLGLRRHVPVHRFCCWANVSIWLTTPNTD